MPTKPLIMSIMKVPGAKIREFREGKGLTTAALAARMNPVITRQAVESWERKGVGAFRTLTKIAKALGMSPALFIESDNGD